MADTNFIDQQTVIQADWANDVNRLAYAIFEDAANKSAARNAISVAPTHKTVSAMDADTSLKVGDLVGTAGYISEDDGGGNLYEIVAASTGTDDGGSFIDLSGSGLQAKGLFPGGRINVRQFGASGDGATEDSPSIQSAIDYCVTTLSKTLHFPSGDYLISSTLTNLVTGLVIEGEGHGSRESSNPRHPTELVWGGGVSTMFRFGDGGTTTVFACIMRNISLDGSDTASVGIHLDQVCANFIFENVLVRDVNTCWELGNSCFATRWYNCVAYGFESYGWRLLSNNHNSNFFGCKAWGGFTKTPLRSVRIGETAQSSNINFYGCDFETWNVESQVQVDNADGVNFFGGYMEAKDANTLYQIQLGTTVAGQIVEGFLVHGVRMIGNTAGQYAIRLVDCEDGHIAGNFAAGFTSSFLFVTTGGASNVILGPNSIGGLTETNTYNGIGKLSGDALSFFTGGTPIATPPVLTAGTASELIAALGTTSGLNLVNDASVPAVPAIRPTMGSSGTVTDIVSGVVTITGRQGAYTIGTEGGAATDDCDTIADATAEQGDIIVVRAPSGSRNVTFKDGTGNLRLDGDFTTLSGVYTLTLFRQGANWLELSRSPN